MRGLFWIPVIGVVVTLASCKEPVHEAQIRALGDEVPGVAVGEYHRAGQPCLTCHGYEGPSNVRFTIAGTVFFGPTRLVGQEGVEIDLIDSFGSKPLVPVKTNCVGNFFVRPNEWEPAFPIRVQVRRGDILQKMESHISRDGSCAACHALKARIDAAAPIYMVGADQEKNQTPPTTECPVNPNLGGGGSNK
jgi:cytochrome c553